jgi:hypothetical protein
MIDQRALANLSAADRKESTDNTLLSLNRVKSDTLVRLSGLHPEEVERLKNEIAHILPAGNLPGLILAGLINLKGRQVTRQRAEDDINALFQGASLVPHALYSILVGGPAVVLSAYQTILRLAGKDVEAVFPEGTWQYYLQLSLREDTGRHTNETIAYHRERPSQATVVDDISAWIMTAIYTLFDTQALSGVLWAEWTTLRLIREAAENLGLATQEPFNTLLRDWQSARPYSAPAGFSYAEERRSAFDLFIQPYLERLPATTRAELSEKLATLAEAERAAFQRQMSLLATLEPGRYSDRRIPVPLWEAKIGLIWRGHTYLFDVCAHDEKGRPLAFTPDGKSWPISFDGHGKPFDPHGKPLTSQGGWLYYAGPKAPSEPAAYLAPPEPALLKGLLKSIMQAQRPPSSATTDLRLIEVPRSQQAALRALLPESTQEALRALSRAPILINWDEQNRNQALGMLRKKARRGIGDHPLTVMRTADSIIFDQSHIFFDGLWGMAMAEVMTNQAIAWCQRLIAVAPAPASTAPQPVSLISSPAFEAAVLEHHVEGSTEAGAETAGVDLSSLDRARRLLRRHYVMLTINDLLLLGRLIHAAEYQPSPDIASEVLALPDELKQVVASSLRASGGINPALLIPMDASLIAPRERIFPTTFRNTISGLLEAYLQATIALEEHSTQPDDGLWHEFDNQRKRFFTYLRIFGQTLDTIKAIAMRGESFNTATLRLLGLLPESMHHLLDQIPQRISLLNEVLKGEEVFSNVGRVARGSSLVRFTSAKDDGRSKTLVWGILTDDSGQMHISLRDFRPHVGPLIKAGHNRLAARLAQDYVESYAVTVNMLARQLIDMAKAEDEMRWD